MLQGGFFVEGCLLVNIAGVCVVESVGAFGLLMFLASMSPGPCLALILRVSLRSDFRLSLCVASAIACSLFIQTLICALGLAWSIGTFPCLIPLIEIAGGLYMAFLGIYMLRPVTQQTSITHAPTSHSYVIAFIMGFFVNSLNPQAILFLVSLLNVFLKPNAPLIQKILYATSSAIAGGTWFSFVAFLLNRPVLHKKMLHFQTWILRVLAIVLLFLALYMVIQGINELIAS